MLLIYQACEHFPTKDTWKWRFDCLNHMPYVYSSGLLVVFATFCNCSQFMCNDLLSFLQFVWNSMSILSRSSHLPSLLALLWVDFLFLSNHPPIGSLPLCCGIWVDIGQLLIRSQKTSERPLWHKEKSKNSAKKKHTEARKINAEENTSPHHVISISNFFLKCSEN